MMDAKDRYGIDRRIEDDRRKLYDLDYFLRGGIEKRSKKERRDPSERRVGWVKTDDWKSLYLGNLISVDDFKNRENIFHAHQEKVVSAISPVENKRQYFRFWIQEHAYVVLRPLSKKFGQIVDISMGGLSYCYPDANKEHSEAYLLDIFLVGDKFYLDKVPFRTVSERNIEIELPDNSLTLKQCGVRFDRLTTEQIQRLDYLIMKYTKP